MNRKHFLAKLSFLNILLVSIVFLVQCKHDWVDLDKQPVISFTTQVLPVFQSSCAKSKCHDGSGDEFALNSYSSISKKISSGDPMKSEAYKAMVSVWFQPMPPSPASPVPQESRTLVFLWIKQGAKNN